MYRLRGADGKEYGPVNAEQLRQWMTEGRVNGSTPVREEGQAEWKALRDFADLGPPEPPPASASSASVGPMSGLGRPPSQGLAITSFVLGLSSLVCLSVFAGIPAIICGHIAHRRAKRFPNLYEGAAFAISGFITGYLSLLMALCALLVLPAIFVPAFSQARDRAQSIQCVNNMKQIGLALKSWGIDHEDQFPFNVTTNKGGTCEYCLIGPDGYDSHAAFHFQALSNELTTTKILVCPMDKKTAAANFEYLKAANISYQLHSGTNYSGASPQVVLVVCPVHGHMLFCDGSVQQVTPRRRK